MKICYISREYPPETDWGGIATYVHEIAQGMVAHGFEVTVISQAVQKESTQRVDGITVHRVLPDNLFERLPLMWRFKQHFPAFSYAAARKFKEIYKTEQFDLVESAECDADSLFVHFQTKKPPVLVRFHLSKKFIDHINGQPNKHKSTHWAERQVLKRADYFSSPSRALVDRQFELFSMDSRPVTVIPNPIDTDLFAPDPSLKEDDHLLYVGRLQYLKGVDLIAEALPILCEQRPKLRCTFLGGDTDYKEGVTWKRHILNIVPDQFHNRLHFDMVSRRSLIQWYNRASLAIFPSRWENFPYVLLESMSTGTPAAITAVGGMPEIVTPGKDGLIIPDHTPEAVISTVLEGFTNPEQLRKMGQHARDKIVQHYGIDSVAQSMAQYYRGLSAQ
ncbi:MAG: glycosyltransferase family 4 protein [Magnetococcales bacterium]|nr:glycosyltransferase family 4 protein [Magnetococcales bacterium]